MSALGFEILDRHVVEGRGDQIACTDASGSLTFAQLLERAGALAGGLRILGVRSGENVAIDLPPGNLQVISVCAAIRLGCIPAGHGETQIRDVGGTPRIQLHDHDLELRIVEQAGMADPAPALRTDPDGYAEAASDAFEDVVESLLSGSPVV